MEAGFGPWKQQFALHAADQSWKVFTAAVHDAGVLLVGWLHPDNVTETVCQYDVHSGALVRLVSMPLSQTLSLCIGPDGNTVLSTHRSSHGVLEARFDSEYTDRHIASHVYCDSVKCTADAIVVTQRGGMPDTVISVFEYKTGASRAVFHFHDPTLHVCASLNVFFTFGIFTSVGSDWRCFSVPHTTSEVTKTADCVLRLSAGRVWGAYEHPTNVTYLGGTTFMLSFLSGTLAMVSVGKDGGVQTMRVNDCVFTSEDALTPRQGYADLVAWQCPEQRKLVTVDADDRSVRVFRALNTRWEWLKAVVSSGMAMARLQK